MKLRAPTLFTGLWVGENLPPMARLCIQSFLDHGHSFQLFSYIEYESLPHGLIVRDARDILPEDAIFRDEEHNSLAPFSDWFRMKFLSEEGGFWVDMDVVCLSDNVPSGDTWFCLQSAEEVNTAAMLFPVHHPVPTALAKLAYDPAVSSPWDTQEDSLMKADMQRRYPDIRERRRRVPWGYCGPRGFTRALRYFGMFEQAAPPPEMYPIPWKRWRALYNGGAKVSDITSETWCIHLWGEMLRKHPRVWNRRTENSLVNELITRHSPVLPPQKSRRRIPLLAEIGRVLRTLFGARNC